MLRKIFTYVFAKRKMLILRHVTLRYVRVEDGYELCLSRSSRGLHSPLTRSLADLGRWADSCLLLVDIRAFWWEGAVFWGRYSGMLNCLQRPRGDVCVASSALCLYRYLYRIGRYLFCYSLVSVCR